MVVIGSSLVSQGKYIAREQLGVSPTAFLCPANNRRNLQPANLGQPRIKQGDRSGRHSTPTSGPFVARGIPPQAMPHVMPSSFDGIFRLIAEVTSEFV